jgi:hypothetical protein
VVMMVIMVISYTTCLVAMIKGRVQSGNLS